jgi:hypothetical protein
MRMSLTAEPLPQRKPRVKPLLGTRDRSSYRMKDGIQVRTVDVQDNQPIPAK